MATAGNTVTKLQKLSFASANNTIVHDSDMLVRGNLTVIGQQTYAQTQNLLVKDNIITLNAAINQSGTPLFDAGIEVDRGVEQNVALLWKESEGAWKFTNDGVNYETLGGGSAGSYANSAFLQANAAYQSANNVAPQVQPAFDKANNAYTHANAAYAAANSVNVYGANTNATGFFAIPNGTIAQRPAAPQLGSLRYNTTNGWPEVYTTNGWQAFAAQPYIISVSPTVIAGNSNAVIDIYGTNFGIEAQVYFIDSLNNSYLANTVTYYSNTHISAPTPRDFLVGVEPLDVKVVQNSGMYTLENAIDCGTVPTWVTTAGSLGSIFGANTVNVYVSATDAEGSVVTYSLTSGSLPGGLNLSSNGLVQGVATGVTATTTYNFTIKASDVVTNNVDRAFSYQILNRVPVFNTASSLSTITDSMLDNYSANVSINAYDPDGGVITYAVTVGSVPTGFTLNSSNGALQLTDANTAEVGSNTTSTFTVSATDVGSGIETRQFNITIQPPTDSDFPNTVLLLSATDSNTVLKDASSNNLNLTVFGDARASNFSPYNSSWSVHIDGGSYLTSSGSTNVQLGTGDFTLECWVYSIAPPTGADYDTIITFGNNGTGAYGLELLPGTASTQFKIRFESYTTGYITTTNDYNQGNWYHVAVVKNGSGSNNLKVYVNGVNDGTATITESLSPSGTNIYIGTPVWNVGNRLLNAYVSNLRLLKGTAQYTTNFTPPTSPLTAISNTQLLVCNTNRFADGSNNSFTFTTTGTPKVVGWSPFAETDTTTGSMYFDGSGDYLIASNAASTVFNFGSDPFTIEAWVYFNSVSGQQCIVTNYQGATNGWAIQLFSSGIGVNLSGDGFDISGPTNIVPYRWYHVALSGTPGATGIKLFIDGLQQSTTYTSSVSLDSSASLTIGTIPGNAYVNGYISDLRILRGTALYTANFAVPTIASTNVANTKLLTLQNRQPHNNHGFQDSSNNKHLITRVGNPSQGTFSPFSSSANNWSVFVPETLGEYIQYTSNSNLSFGSGQFSVDAWVYTTGTSTSQGYGSKAFFSQGNNATNQMLAFYMDTTNRSITFGGPGSYNTSYNNVINRNEWTHVAVTRDASNIERIFVNGKLVASRVNTTNWGTFVNDYTTRIGCFYDSNYPSAYSISAYASQLAGYISNLRINVGSIPTELQTSSNTANAVIFVPPTSVVQDANTRLLMCRNNRHRDSSIYNWTPSAVTSSISVQPFSPFSPNAVYTTANVGGSVYMDGSGDYLSIASNPNLAIGTSDFTVEYWAYPTAFGTSRSHIMWVTVGDFLALYTNSSGNIVLDRYGASTLVSATSNALVLNSWNHVVCSRVGTTLRIFINGVQGASITNSTNWATTEVQIGNNNQTAYFLGYMCGMRVLKGTGVSSVTIPTTPFTPVANTILLLNFDNAAIDDYTGKNVVETAGDAKANNIITKFAPGSFSLDGSSDGLILQTSSGFFTFRTNNFTIEFWAYSNANQANYTKYFCTGGSVGNIFIDQQTIANRISVNDGSTVFLESTSGITNQAWNHVAIVRSGTTLTIYINGVAVGSATNSTSFTAASTAGVGSNISGGQTFNGVLSDFRVTRSARYTANFTPRPRRLPRR